MYFISIPKAARRLGCSINTVRLMINEGTLPTVTIGRRRRIDEDTLLEWIRQGGAKRDSGSEASE
jgi:excisionase family DNA binding protein